MQKASDMRTFKLHGSGPFAGTCVYATIKHLSLTGEGVVMEFDPVPYPDVFPPSFNKETFSNVEICMKDFAVLHGSVSTDIFFVESGDIPGLWTEWIKWHGSNVEWAERQKQ